MDPCNPVLLQNEELDDNLKLDKKQLLLGRSTRPLLRRGMACETMVVPLQKSFVPLTDSSGYNLNGNTGDEVDYVSSVSRCESERGTFGRGTPPVREIGQPRLDELLRKIQSKQEKEARKAQGENDDGIGNTPNFNQWYSQGTTTWINTKSHKAVAEIPVRPKILRADILHKNSSYYNHQIQALDEAGGAVRSAAEHRCDWKQCRARFISCKDLLRHIQEEHLSCLPLHATQEHNSQRLLVCKWRQCRETRCFPDRYKLLLHLQKCHCSITSTIKTEAQD